LFFLLFTYFSFVFSVFNCYLKREEI